MSTKGWADEMLARLDDPDRWSVARVRAEQAWSEIWRGPTGYAISGSRIISVERRRNRGVGAWRAAA